MLEHWPADDHVEMRVGKAERVNVVPVDDPLW
jgi:hypothetical protein